MFCMKCSNDLSQCTCDDIEERLQNAAGSGHFAYKKCATCGKHYSRCECAEPKWVIERKRD